MSAQATELSGRMGARIPQAPIRRRRRLRGEFLFVLPAIVYVAATVLYPLAYNIGLSFFKVGAAEVTGLVPAPWVGLQNYIDELSLPAFWFALLISLLYTTLSVGVAVVVGLALAALFTKKFPGAGQIRAALLIAWILPSVVSANIWRWVFNGSYGLLNAALRAIGVLHGDVYWLGQSSTALLALVLATAWSLAPFAMVLLTAGIQSVPETLYEAARVDGATRRQQFWRITLPLLRPVLLTTVLLCFIYTFVSFDTIFLMTAGGPGSSTKALTVYAYQEAFTYFRFSDGAVGTTILLVVPTILAIVYFRSLRREEVA
jgi:multiple sugar transport system permease protein